MALLNAASSAVFRLGFPTICLFLLALAAPARAVEVSGSQFGLWTLAKSPYIVTGDIVVPAGQTLEIEGGVVVQFAGAFSFRVEGAIKAIGGEHSRVVFTSRHDRDFSFNTGTQDPTTGDWQGIVLADGIDALASALENVLIRYARAPLEIGSSKPATARNILIMDCASRTIFVAGEPITYQESVDLNLTGKPLSLRPAVATPVPAPEISEHANGTPATAPPPMEQPPAPAQQFSFGEIESEELPANSLRVFGYFSTRYSKIHNEPRNAGGRTITMSRAPVFSYPQFSLQLQHQLANRFKAAINLNGDGGEGIDVRAFWAEYSLSPAANLRLGKIYRKFGQYNEILDATPTYYGIEPPEILNPDHPMLSRTTALMFYGHIDAGPGKVHYSLSTDNGEGGAVHNVYPLGGDLHFKSDGGSLLVGFSGYTSNGKAVPDVAVGNGPPQGAVLPWLAHSEFSVAGIYGETLFGELTLQAAYFVAQHNARRDPALVTQLLRRADPALNANQLARLLRNPELGASDANVNLIADFNVRSWYLRSGYALKTAIGIIAPYGQLEWYGNPETIADRRYGGDNAAGLADNGQFHKATLGLVFRPVPQVALKFDGSSHRLRFNGKLRSYEEVRVDASVMFGSER